MHIRKLATVTAAIVVGLSTSIVFGSADSSRTVTLKGTERFVPNALINADFRFSPGPLSVKSGDTVTWQNTITSPDPHTISIVPAGSLPATISQVFNCGAPGTPCAPILACHFPQGFGGPGGPPPTIVPVCGNAANGQLKAVGDSFLIPPPGFGPPSAQTIMARITAPPGSILVYMCVIHPWMQGEINVS
jgi:plastocyanin